MEQKKNEQKTAQIVYMTVLLVLLVMAIAVGMVSAIGKRGKPVESTEPTTSAIPFVQNLPDKDHTSPSVTTALPRVTLATTEKTQPAPEATTAATTPRPVVAVEEPISSLPVFDMPTIGNVSKTFSIDTLVWSNTMEDYRTHNGIDVCASLGEGVMAAADGVVTEVYAHPLMGNTVVIAHDGDAVTVYQNLADEIPVSAGERVKRGEVIGAVGESAMIEIAEEPHLHFEIFVGSDRVDPLSYISKATMTIVYEE